MGKENVPLPPGVKRPPTPTEFPKYYYSPEGVQIVAKSIGDVPEGYTPYNPADAERAAAAKAATAAAAPVPVVLPLNKKAVIYNLKQGGIEHDPSTSHESLYALLLTGVKAALTDAKVEFDATESDVKKLLGLFPTS